MSHELQAELNESDEVGRLPGPQAGQLDQSRKERRRRFVQGILVASFVVLSIFVVALWEPGSEPEMPAPAPGPGPTPRELVDRDTPASAYHKTASTGETYELVFSDEFEEEGRSFGPGQDKRQIWEAVNVKYWQTLDLETYAVEQVRTRGGKLVINMTNDGTPERPSLLSGMVQSWNKFCFQGGILEFRATLPGWGRPGDPVSMGYWPGLWTMGNLGRAGYGASTDGVWPYTYDRCDAAVNQSTTTGSALSPQRINACVEQPGPGLKPRMGRGAPEIDVMEGMVSQFNAFTSQTFQLAPFSEGQNVRASGISYNTAIPNPWKGSPNQQAASGNTLLPPSVFGGTNSTAKNSAGLFGVEYLPGKDGYIRWTFNGVETWRLNSSSLAADDVTGQRLIPEEPMYIIMNLAVSPTWGNPDVTSMKFPAEFAVDYVRLYQPVGSQAISCNPDSHPTREYIETYRAAYNDSALIRWTDAQFPNGTSYTVPNFSLPTSRCTAACRRPTGFCSVRTGRCVCSIGWKGDNCTELNWPERHECYHLIKNATCEPFAWATDHDIMTIYSWICANVSRRNVSHCDKIDYPPISDCHSALAKATYLMSNYYAAFKKHHGDRACWFGGVGRIL